MSATRKDTPRPVGSLSEAHEAAVRLRVELQNMGLGLQSERAATLANWLGTQLAKERRAQNVAVCGDPRGSQAYYGGTFTGD